MKLTPFIQVDDVPFSTSPAELRARKGAPLTAGRNDVGLNELDYGDCVFRFQDSGQLEEVTKQALVIQLPKVAVPIKALKSFVLAQDPEAFERAGFMVSPKYGVAFTPKSSTWVTALARHSIDAWRSL